MDLGFCAFRFAIGQSLLADILEISTQVVGHIPHRVLVIAGTRRLGTRNLKPPGLFHS
jgi:hypothetical protein